MSHLPGVRGRRVCPLVVLIVALAGCSGGPRTPSAQPAGGSVTAATASGLAAGATASAAVTATASPAPSASPTASSRPAARATSGLTALDRRAGLRSRTVTWTAGGRLVAVPGHSAAPGRGRIYTVQVEVEAGLDVDRTAFATFVLATLNDRRSWTEHGTRRFARTSGPADIRVVLASPATSAALCRPLLTFGKLSCRSGPRTAVLTYYRWVKAIPGYGSDRNGYREYVVNHEVGHVLGHHHQYCAGPGRLAPLMMQQTKGLHGCRPNPWPHP